MLVLILIEVVCDCVAVVINRIKLSPSPEASVVGESMMLRDIFYLSGIAYSGLLPLLH